jgi:patatin-like phospholipase/acyl hydrolase
LPPIRTPRKATKEKVFKFTDGQLKDIADKLINTFMQPSNSLEMTMGMSMIMKDLEKNRAGKSSVLKQKQSRSDEESAAGIKAYAAAGKSLESEFDARRNSRRAAETQ